VSGRYRKKPVVIEAVQWTGKNLGEVAAFCGNALGPIERRMDYKLKVRTLESGEGYHEVDDDDWIIRGVKGEIYPCKPDIFEATYELVMDESPHAT
jgi:hypothetical protein